MSTTHVDDENKHYPGMGRPCPNRCGCFFFCDSDLKAHLESADGCKNRYQGWKRSKFDKDKEIWYIPASLEPKLAHFCKINGKTTLGSSDFWLSNNGVFLLKTNHIER